MQDAHPILPGDAAPPEAPQTLPQTPPRVSVVIPTYNRRASLERVLRALARQTVAPDAFEALVVSDGSDDGTVPLSRRVAGEVPYTLRLIEQANAGPAVARNRGVAAARAALILFLDDDVVPDPGLIEAHLAAHAPDTHDALVAIGPLLPPRDTRLNAWGAWEERALCKQYAAMEAGRWAPTWRQFYTGNASLARRRLLAAGGFDAGYRRAEDVELGLRLREAGLSFAYLPQARGWHYVRRSFRGWAALPVAYGWAVVALGRARGRLGRAELANAAQDFYARNLAVRIVARGCAGRARRVALMTQALGVLAVLAWALRLSPFANLWCSVLYNLRFYHGVAEALGGRDALWRLVGQARPQSALDRRHGAERRPELLAFTARLLGADRSADLPAPAPSAARDVKAAL